MNITAEKLRDLAPTSSLSIRQAIAGPLTYYLPQYQIHTRDRIAAFLAQAAHETAHFQTLKEYGDARYFKRYNNREDLGNGPTDGPIFFGRGIFQLTGRANYESYGRRLGVDLVNNPALAENGDNSVRIACLYWTDKNLNPLADVGGPYAFVGITYAINGGLNGLANRRDYYQRALGMDWFK